MQLFNTGSIFFIVFITSSMIFVPSCKKKSSSDNRSSESSATEETADNESSDQTTGELPDGASNDRLKEIKATISGEPKNSTVNPILDITISGSSEDIYKYKLGESGSTNCSSSNGYSEERNTSQHITDNTSALNDGSMRLCVVTLGENGLWQEFSNATESTWIQDLLLPAVLSVASSTADGSYNSSDSITIAITFNEAVSVQGNPTLNLATGGAENHNATYQSGSNSKVLIFIYSIEKGDTSPDLSYIDTSSLKLNGGSIKDAFHDSNLTLPTLLNSKSLSSQSAIIIITDQTVNLSEFPLKVILAKSSTSTMILNASDGGDDIDSEGAAISYTCWFDNTADSSVTEEISGLCSTSNLSGLTFNNSTGELSWDPNESQVGIYEFKIKGESAASYVSSDIKYEKLIVTNADLNVGSSTWAHEAYIKPANPDESDFFGYSLDMHENTLVIGSLQEGSNENTITNGTGSSDNNDSSASGAVYVYKRDGSNWSQQAYIKASNNDVNDKFSRSLSIDDDTLAVGAHQEDSDIQAITNGNASSNDNSSPDSGAVYIYKRNSNSWQQEAYIKASNSNTYDQFGTSVALNNDTLAVGAYTEDAGVNTITNGVDSSLDRSAPDAGSVYIYKRNGNEWTQESYIKSSNNETLDRFGYALSLDNNTLAVGASGEDSNQNSITNDISSSSDNSSIDSGAVYVYQRTGASWSQEAYIKASNSGAGDVFGNTLSLSGNYLAVGAYNEDSNQRSITNSNEASADDSTSNSGAVYIYKRSAGQWVQDSYIKSSNSDANDAFGYTVKISGNTLAVTAKGESSTSNTITNSDSASDNNDYFNAGAVYLFEKRGNNWVQTSYLKAFNNQTSRLFGFSLALDQDSLAVGSFFEDSSNNTITNGSPPFTDVLLTNSGATYVYKRTSSEATANSANGPKLEEVNTTSLSESASETMIFDLSDTSNPGQDIDADNDSLRYSCWFDNTQDDNVAESNSTRCKSENLSGLNFDKNTGVLNWNPEEGQAGSYEFMVVATDNILADVSFIDLTVN